MIIHITDKILVDTEDLYLAQHVNDTEELRLWFKFNPREPMIINNVSHIEWRLFEDSLIEVKNKEIT